MLQAELGVYVVYWYCWFQINGKGSFVIMGIMPTEAELRPTLRAVRKCSATLLR